MTINQEILHISQHSFTAILWVDSHFKINWANASAEHAFNTSASKLQEKSLLEVLSVIKSNKASTSQSKPAKFLKKFSAYTKLNKSKKTTTAEIEDTNAEIDLTANEFLKLQLANAKSSMQPFISHDQWVKGVHQPMLSDYGVTPIERHGEVFFLVELWIKDRQLKIHKDHQQKAQHGVARQMLRAVAHEVKNPLAGIRGAAQLLEKQVNKRDEVDSKIATYCDIIIDETDRLNNLISQMLGSNKLPKWSEFNIHEMLERVLTLAHSQNQKMDIVRDYDLSLPEITADKNQLIQVFLNLVTNAIEAMQQYALLQKDDENTESNTPYIPTLTISTRVEFQYAIGSITHKQVAKISVIDNGGGIDEELISQIFFPLVTGRANGTGLGLSLVHDIIQRHYGYIEVDSIAGRTCFTVYLPFKQTAVETIKN